MKHIFIAGGTGMLKGAAEHFIEQGHIVSLMARNSDRLEAIRAKYPKRKGKILTLSQDYRDTEKAMKSVINAADMYSYIDLAVLWIHTSGVEFSEAVKEFLFKHHHKTIVFQLWGSATIHPKKLSQKEWREQCPERYREIFLGYKQNGDSVRWLTDREISEGTIRAVELDKPEFKIGIVDPWIVY
jgi:hypothetical protein